MLTTSLLLLLLASLCAATATARYVPPKAIENAWAKPQRDMATQTRAVNALARRVLGAGKAANVHLTVNGAYGYASDAFTLSAAGGSVFINGTSGVAVASGLYHYLKAYCGVQITWGVNGTGEQLSLPAAWPSTGSRPIQRQTPNLFRYYMNVCTVSYSGAWWDWTRWQKEIDWMALHGINLPLTFTGQELVWQQLWREVGLSDAEIQRWLAGPAFLAWQRMGNLRGWAGPLSQSWMQKQAAMGVLIANRQAELGMTNVLPGFAGHVPAALRFYYPNANITQSPNWWGAPANYCCDYLLEPRDPLFTTLGKRFYQLITQQFGNTSMFNSDTFNEMLPASNDTTYLAQTSAAVAGALQAFDPSAIWLMQGWLFVNDPEFWSQQSIKAYLSGAPDDTTLILDLWSEAVPVWSSTQSYYGKPFIWCMLHNFGGNRDLYGDLKTLASGPVSARNTAGSTMVGTGLTPEAIEQNPVVYELMTEMGWNAQAPAIPQWLDAYATQRYGAAVTPALLQVWQLLLVGAYSSPYMTDSAITHVPDLSMPTRQQALANFTIMVDAWRIMEGELQTLPGPLPGPLLYDALDLLRQVLVNLFEDARHIHAHTYSEYVAAANTRSSQSALRSLRGLGALMTNLIVDLDALLATNPNFLLGTWTSTARSWAADAAEAAQLQFNALNQITLWGNSGEIWMYAAKQWSPLCADFYYEHWVMFTDAIEYAVASGVPFNAGNFDAAVLQRDLAWNYANNNTVYPTATSGDQLAVSGKLTARYTAASGFTPAPGKTVAPSARLLQAAALTRDVASLGVLCQADPECGGFTSDGFFVQRGAAAIAGAGVTLFVRTN
jgi:alpha-N-acetylglucosaminidase